MSTSSECCETWAKEQGYYDCIQANKPNTHEIYVGIKSLKLVKPEYNSEMQSY